MKKTPTKEKPTAEMRQRAKQAKIITRAEVKAMAKKAEKFLKDLKE